MLLRRTIGMPDGLFEMQQGVLNIYVCVFRMGGGL